MVAPLAVRSQWWCGTGSLIGREGGVCLGVSASSSSACAENAMRTCNDEVTIMCNAGDHQLSGAVSGFWPAVDSMTALWRSPGFHTVPGVTTDIGVTAGHVA